MRMGTAIPKVKDSDRWVKDLLLNMGLGFYSKSTAFRQSRQASQLSSLREATTSGKVGAMKPSVCNEAGKRPRTTMARSLAVLGE